MAGKNSQTQTNSSSVDPATQAYIEAYRNRAQNLPTYKTGMGGIEDYTNPYQQRVIGQIQSEGTRQMGLANNQAADMATRANAFGGSREAVLRAQMMGDVNRNTANQVAQYSASGYEDAANRMMQDRMNQYNVGFGNLQAMTPGFTPTTQNSTTTQTQNQSLWPQLLGAGLTVGGALLGGPVGAGVGKGLSSSAQWTGNMNGPTGSGQFIDPYASNPWDFGQGGWK